MLSEPAPRYAEIAPRVREICQRYGIHDNSAGFWSQYGSVLKRIAVHAWPTRSRVVQVMR